MTPATPIPEDETPVAAAAGSDRGHGRSGHGAQSVLDMLARDGGPSRQAGDPESADPDPDAAA